jgi:cyclic pyranopterin monophosphate synthase
MEEQRLSHVDADGRATMVDVGAKPITDRRAVAGSRVAVSMEVLDLIERGETPKGAVLRTAELAGVQAAKRTAELIPLCHPLALSLIQVDCAVDREASAVTIRTEVRCTGQTGVEMEALTAASVAALTVYDMIKAIDRGAIIGPTKLLEKSGGASGSWRRDA